MQNNPSISVRLIQRPEDLHLCDKCGCLATHSCTDAFQGISGEWEEGKHRYGCMEHPVSSLIYMNDSTVMSAKDYHLGSRSTQ